MKILRVETKTLNETPFLKQRISMKSWLGNFCVPDPNLGTAFQSHCFVVQEMLKKQPTKFEILDAEPINRGYNFYFRYAYGYTHTHPNDRDALDLLPHGYFNDDA